MRPCVTTLSFQVFRAVFIPAQIINFAIVPHHLRFGVVSVVSLFWSRCPCGLGTIVSFRLDRYLSQRCECPNRPRKQRQAPGLIPSIIDCERCNIVYIPKAEDTGISCNHTLHHILESLQKHARSRFCRTLTWDSCLALTCADHPSRRSTIAPRT